MLEEINGKYYEVRIEKMFCRYCNIETNRAIYVPVDKRRKAFTQCCTCGKDPSYKKIWREL
jgi:hypothetical protein